MSTAASTKERLPDLRNATLEFLIDETRNTRVELNRLKKLEAYYSTALKARIPTDEQGAQISQSSHFAVTVNTVTQERISTELCRELLPPELLAQVTVTTSFQTLKFSPITTAATNNERD